MADSGNEQGKSRFGVIGLVALIGSAFIGLNTLVTSCASEDAASNAAKLHAAEEDEQFWTGAIQELSDISRDKNKADGNFESRCALLASRTAPFIAEVNTMTAERKGQSQPADNEQPAGGDGLTAETRELTKRVRMLRDEFVRLLSDEAITSLACKAEYEFAQARAETELATKQRVELAPLRETRSAQATTTPPQERDPLIVLSRLSAKGYDIDVFWCEDGEAESQLNFEDAYRFASQLAAISKANERISGQSNQYEIGRIRVRRLAAELWQTKPEYSGVNSLNVLRYGPQEQGERDLASTIVAQPYSTGIGLEESLGSTSPWYLSAYFCKANTGSAVTAAPEAAAL